MTLRLRLIITMVVLVVVGLTAVVVITLSSLHSYLYGRVDDQLTAATTQMHTYLVRAEQRGYTITPESIATRVSPEIYVEVIPTGGERVIRPSTSDGQASAPPSLPVGPAVKVHRRIKTDQVYRPDPGVIDVPSQGGRGPEYRLEATSFPEGTVVVATSLDSVQATLSSLRTVELVVSLVLLAALVVLMTLLIRLGLRPLEDMAYEADAIAAGDLSRRVESGEGDGEIARLGRALNGMLEQIESAFAQRTQSEDRLRSFLADASHELRTPLTTIRGYAELLQKGALEDEAARSRALDRIEREAARMGVLVGDLSILAREGDALQYSLHRIDLAAVATDAVADARALEPTRPIELRTSGEVPVAGDEVRLEQVAHNLLNNALVHTPAGTPIEVQVSVVDGNAVLSVRDHGPGLAPEHAAHVFDRFYRGEADRLVGGSGLGLFIVAALTRSLDGQASVSTAEGEGSTFEVTLPVYSPHAGPVPELLDHRARDNALRT
jgi:two-component system OmpR family sensor kinase